MKAVIQRVLRAAVSVDGRVTGSIERGYMILLGIASGDDTKKCETLAKKIMNLRIFADESGKTNLSIKDISGNILVISQFTLCADCSHGNRPSFVNAMAPEPANTLYERFCDELGALGIMPQKGIFGADMKIDMLCDGPFTVVLEI